MFYNSLVEVFPSLGARIGIREDLRISDEGVLLLERRPGNELVQDEALEQVLVLRQFLELLVRKGDVHKIGLFVVVRTEDQEYDLVLKSLNPEILGFLYIGSCVNRLIRREDVEILGMMSVVSDHQVVKSDFEILNFSRRKLGGGKRNRQEREGEKQPERFRQGGISL